ncbi:MAG: hypothetical protein JWO38_563 [Gemmataceae bacterium]|nr:hypothetical protein [Gemmataceae bacterium]
MPLARSIVRVALFSLIVAAIVAPTTGLSHPVPVSQPAPAKPVTQTEVEVRCVDDSTIKLKILDERLEVGTRYGALQIPVADIRRVEFATRTPADVAERIGHLISNLNHPDFDMRERATADLRDYRERAYFPLLKAIKHSDLEISRRAEESVRYLQQKLPAGNLEPREHDVIYTDDSKITGKLNATTLRVQTFQFGEQNLRLADIRTLRSATGVAAEDLANAPAAPANMSGFQNQFGKEVAFVVTGPQPGGQAMGVWGTDAYTLDSNLAAAAVHAGLVQPGHSGVVRVRVVASPPQFVGSLRYGVGSAPYGNYPAGAYEFVRK